MPYIYETINRGIRNCNRKQSILADLALPVSTKSSQSNAENKRCTPFISSSPVAWNILEKCSTSQAQYFAFYCTVCPVWQNENDNGKDDDNDDDDDDDNNNTY
jgi:hypothetical protein